MRSQLGPYLGRSISRISRPLLGAIPKQLVSESGCPFPTQRYHEIPSCRAPIELQEDLHTKCQWWVVPLNYSPGSFPRLASL
jgi:hypothetical protein